MIITIKSARGTDPTKAQQPLANGEKGANFRKKDLRDGIAKKDFSLSCLQAGFFYFNGGQDKWLTKKSDFSLQKA